MIKLSNKWDYAMKSIIFIWKHKDDILKIWDISTTLDISESLLRRIVADLEKSSILKTIKGRNGGIRLWKDLKDISVYDILFSVGEELGISDCTKWEYCDKKHNCSTTDTYSMIQKWLNGILKIYTLDKIIKS